MNKTEIEKLLREVTNFAESMKLNFGNAQVIRHEIAKIVDIQQQLNQINTKIEGELKHLGFTSFFENVVSTVGNVVNNVFNVAKTGGKVAVGVGTLAAGIGLLSLGFDLSDNPDLLSSISSDFAFDFGQDVLSNSVDHLGSIRGNQTKNNKQSSNTKDKTEYLKLGLISLKEGIASLIQQGEKLKAIGHYCLNNPDLLKCFDNSTKTIDIKSFEENCNKLQENIQLLLTFDRPNLFKEQANHFTKIIEDFDCQKQFLKKILQTFDAKIHENPTAIETFLSVFGNTILDVYFDRRKEALDITFYSSKKCIVKGKDIQQKYLRLEKQVFQAITQCNYLKSFVLAYSFTETSAMKELAKYHNNRIVGDIEYKQNEINKQIKLNFLSNRKAIQLEVNNIYAIQQSLEEIEKNLETIINGLPAPKNKIFNVTDLEKIIEIFGIAIEAIEFHSDEEATISIHGYRQKVKEIYQNYSSLKQNVTALIKEAEQKIKLVEEHLQKNRLVRRLAVTSVMIMLSLSSLIGYLIFRQEQLWIQTQRLVAELEEVSNPSNIEDLKVSHEKLTQAIARLEQVPNTIISPYERAQNDLVNLRSRKDIIEQKINTEQQARVSLEASQKAAMEATMLVQKPTYTIGVGQQAQAKWQEAINLLKTIPDSTFVSTQAKEKLVTYQSNYDSLTIRASSEQKASANLDMAKKLSWEAAKAIQQPPHPVSVWKEARHKLQKAVELLEGISNNTPIFAEVQQKLITYRYNYVAISKRLIIEENAAKNLILAENLAKQAVATVQSTPYTVKVLQNAQSRLGQATLLLKSIPSGTSVSSNAASLIQGYNRNYKKINNRIKEVETCISLQQSYCLEANTSLELNSY